jgi:hypothetical protein
MGLRQVHLLNRVGARTSGIVFSIRRIYRLNETTFSGRIQSVSAQLRGAYRLALQIPRFFGVAG